MCVTGCKVTELIKEKYLFNRSFTRLIVTLKNQMGGEVRFDPACFLFQGPAPPAVPKEDNMKHEWFGFYCEREDDPDGRVDTLRLDFTDRTYEYIALLDRSRLGKGYYGTTLMEVPVTAEQLTELHRIVRACFEGGSMTTGGGLCGDVLPVLHAAEPERETVAKERVLAAVRRTLTEEATASIAAHGKPERADYFDLPAMLSAVEDFLEGKMSASAFADWCLLMMRCFQDGGSFRGVPGLWELYDELADSFDGMAFTSEDCTDEETRLCVLEFYAELKYKAHRRRCLLQKKEKPFQKNSVVIYAAFAFTAGADGEDERCVYFFCTADHRRKRVNYYQMDDPEFDRALCYTMISLEEFEDLPSRYVYYALDRTLFASAQKGS